MRDDMLCLGMKLGSTCTAGVGIELKYILGFSDRNHAIGVFMIMLMHMLRLHSPVAVMSQMQCRSCPRIRQQVHHAGHLRSTPL